MSGVNGERDALLSDQSSVVSEREQRRRDILKLTDRYDDDEENEERGTKMCMGAIYMLAMGICGMVLVALGSSLEYLAGAVGKTSTELGTLFLARGIGSITGAIISAKFYKWFYGNTVMIGGIIVIAAVLLSLVYNKSTVLLHVLFAILGVCTALVDTGVQIQTRKLHGLKAGPWLGANTVCFGCAGAIVPLIEMFVDREGIEFFILSALTLSVGVAMFAMPPVEDIIRGRGPGAGPPPRPKGAHYNVEIVLSMMVFMYIGGKVAITGYLYTFIEETEIIDPQHETSALLVLWIFITIGRLCGVYDQAYVNNTTLPIHLFVLSAAATMAMVSMLVFHGRAIALWLGLAFFGLFNGPCVGYCYDMNNRLTSPSEESMAIVMLGLNMGASIVPWLVSVAWDISGNPYTLVWAGALCNALPLLPIFFLKGMSYDPLVNPYLKGRGEEDSVDSPNA